jgi:hypothetical protein
MTPQSLLSAHRQLWQQAFSVVQIFKRLGRHFWQLRPGALLLSLAMNSFYGLKALRGNLPRDMTDAIESASTQNEVLMTCRESNPVRVSE